MSDIIKRDDYSELAVALSDLAEQKQLSIKVSNMSYDKIDTVNVQVLQTAIHVLEDSFSENCCQAECCQTCQELKCQTTKCQTCQGCQVCQRCQTCQSCQTVRNCQCDCNCDCGDDGE